MHRAYRDLAEAAELLRLLLNVSDIDDFDGSLSDYTLLFYAIVFEAGDAGRPIAFVRKQSPTAPLKRASAWFRFDGALELADPPDMAIEDSIDLVVTSSELAVLRASAFDQLFADVRALLNDIPAAVSRLATVLPNLKLTERTKSAFVAACSTRVSDARRLQRLAEAGDLDAVTPTELRRVLRRHGSQPSDYLTGNDLDIDAHHVHEFLDVVEGRWFSADFSGQRRRADRFRAR